MFVKARVREWLQTHFLLRLHMFFILGGTFLAGLAATKLLLLGEVNVLPLRYALAVCAAYLVFLALIRLWLAYIRSGGIDISPDGIDFTVDSLSDAADAVTADFDGRHFGGGGASGSWTADGASAPAKAAKGGGGGGGRLGFDLDLGEGCLVIALLLALVGLLFFAGTYLIYTAPTLFTEAAFEALLAAALVKRARKIERPGWVGVVWRATVWPFLGVLLLSIALGWAIQHECPEAKRLRDAFHCRSDIFRRHDQ